MAVDEQDSDVNHPLPDPPTRSVPFVEVVCRSSGKRRRFAAGTEAGFAVSLMNRKLEGGPLASHIEAVKEGEEPVSFGPNSVLVDYGDGWKLQTEIGAEGLRKREFSRPSMRLISSGTAFEGSRPMSQSTLQPGISFLYIGKILLAFVLVFVMGAALTLALENLPRLILYINSSL